MKTASFNHNKINKTGSSKIVRTLCEFAREAGLTQQSLAGIAKNLPLPAPEFVIMARRNQTNHYTRESLVKWLLEYRAKFEDHSS